MSAGQRQIEDAIAQAQRRLQDGRAGEAAALCEEALRVAPEHPALLKIGAVAAFQSGDPGTAKKMLEAAVDRFPDDPEAHFNLGVVYQAGGLLEAALDSFSRSTRLSPGAAAAHYNRATALHELGRLEEAVTAYRDAVAAEPRNAPGHAGLAFVLRSIGRLEEAVAAYEQALDCDSQDAQSQSGYGIALQLLGRLAEAAAALRRAAALDPDYPDACTNLADVLVEQGDPEAAIAECDRFLARHPGETGVLAAKAIALSESGAVDTFNRLVDFDRFVFPEHQPSPPGFVDIANFNDALAAHMLAHPTLVDAPASHATRHGKHTGELLGDEDGPVAAFHAMVRDAVGRYQQRLGSDPAHPFVAGALRHWRLTAWSIVLQDGGGYQAAHIHPSAWLSGVYYPRVPEIVDHPGAEQAGWIEFGQPSEEFHWSRLPPLRAVRPEPGLLVLFPSYFFHRTIPYDTDGTRISVAFDVLPAG